MGAELAGLAVLVAAAWKRGLIGLAEGAGAGAMSVAAPPDPSAAAPPSSSTDVFTPAERSAVMRAVRGRDTTPELKVRRLLTAMGLRYRLHRRDLPGSPDVALPGRKTAIFVHGCFWHGHDCRRGAREPKQNADYWRRKIARNRERDGQAQRALGALGWRALTVWECELKNEAALAVRLREALEVVARG